MYVVWHRDGYSRRKGQREHPELQMSHLHAVNTDVVESINIAAPHHVAWNTETSLHESLHAIVNRTIPLVIGINKHFRMLLRIHCH